MAKIEFSGTTLTPPRWAGDYFNREHLVPGPFRLDAEAFTAGPGGRKHVPSGTVVGRTFAERDAEEGFGPAAASDNEVYLIAFDVTDAADNPDFEAYRPNSQVRVNFLPEWDDLAAGVRTLVQNRYLTTLGE